MGRGQYDRAAAKAKREGSSDQFAADNMAAYQSIPALSQGVPGPLLVRLPPTDETAGDVLTIVQLRAEIARKDDLIARMKRLCQTHGLMIDG